MCLKQNVSILKNFKLGWKSNWFVSNALGYKKHIYEDVFVRKYVVSFFSKWSKAHKTKVIGSLHLFRTLGKLYINVFFFYPIKSKVDSFFQKKKLYKFGRLELKPIAKCKKQLSLVVFFYSLEKILSVQVFFKFINVVNAFNSPASRKVSKILSFLNYRFSYFKHQFRTEVYNNTIQLLVHVFKYKKPDSTLLANYVAAVLPSLHKHTQYLMFLKKLLQTLQKFFKFNGVRLLLSGKLNGFTRAQTKQVQVGCVSFQTYDFPFTEGLSDSFTRGGKIGVKVWVC